MFAGAPLAVFGFPGWVELALIVGALLIFFLPRILDFLARLAAERERYR
ncbi:MAG: hypothetical protein AAGG01_04070 [Planctomycetota bacterium]